MPVKDVLWVHTWNWNHVVSPGMCNKCKHSSIACTTLPELPILIVYSTYNLSVHPICAVCAVSAPTVCIYSCTGCVFLKWQHFPNWHKGCWWGELAECSICSILLCHLTTYFMCVCLCACVLVCGCVLCCASVVDDVLCKKCACGFVDFVCLMSCVWFVWCLRVCCELCLFGFYVCVMYWVLLWTSYYVVFV
jgi:hypothetical protein